MSDKKLTGKEEAYAKAVVQNGGDKVVAYKAAGYSVNMSTATICVQADKVYNKPKVNLRIAELQIEADKIAKEKFGITIEQRLMWLKEVAEAGLTVQEVKRGEDTIKARENLTATTGAIRVMNEMLGTDQETSGTKPVKVIIGVQDAS